MQISTKAGASAFRELATRFVALAERLEQDEYSAGPMNQLRNAIRAEARVRGSRREAADALDRGAESLRRLQSVSKEHQEEPTTQEAARRDLGTIKSSLAAKLRTATTLMNVLQASTYFTDLAAQYKDEDLALCVCFARVFRELAGGSGPLHHVLMDPPMTWWSVAAFLEHALTPREEEDYPPLAVYGRDFAQKDGSFRLCFGGASGRAITLVRRRALDFAALCMRATWLSMTFSKLDSWAILPDSELRRLRERKDGGVEEWLATVRFLTHNPAAMLDAPPFTDSFSLLPDKTAEGTVGSCPMHPHQAPFRFALDNGLTPKLSSQACQYLANLLEHAPEAQVSLAYGSEYGDEVTTIRKGHEGWRRLQLTEGQGGDLAELDGETLRLTGQNDLPFLQALQEQQGGIIKAQVLEDGLGERPSRIWSRLPPELQAIVEKPLRGGTGYRML